MTPPVPADHSPVATPGATWYYSGLDLSESTAVQPADGAGRPLRLEMARWVPGATVAFLFLGVLLRFRQYLFDRSLWYDETLIALNIIARPIPRLIPPLDNHQGAPLGFLALEKAAVLAFGTNEYALRLVPLVAGVAALVLLYLLVRRILPPVATLASVGLFALSSQQIGYSTELKQYSMDAAVALLVMFVAIGRWPAGRRRDLMLLTVIGAAAVWFSYPAAFVLAGIGIALALAAAVTREWQRLAKLALVGIVWGLSFAACYWITLRPVASDTLLSDIWSEAFLPWPVSYWTMDWTLSRMFGIFHQPVGMTLSGLGAFVFLLGMIRRDGDWPINRWLLVSPLLVAFAAAAVHRYPFDGRFLNFAVPLVLVVVGAGVAYIADATWRTGPAIVYSLLALLFLHPLWTDAYDTLRPQGNEEIRPVLDYVRQHQQPGDSLYLYWRAEPAFAYYSDQWGHDARLESGKLLQRHWNTDATGPGDLDTLETVGASGRTARFERELELYRGQSRVWVVFYHVKVQDGRSEEQWFREQLQHMGRERDHVSMPGASAYLYDLSAVALPG